MSACLSKRDKEQLLVMQRRLENRANSRARCATYRQLYSQISFPCPFCQHSVRAETFGKHLNGSMCQQIQRIADNKELLMCCVLFDRILKTRVRVAFKQGDTTHILPQEVWQDCKHIMGFKIPGQGDEDEDEDQDEDQDQDAMSDN